MNRVFDSSETATQLQGWMRRRWGLMVVLAVAVMAPVVATPGPAAAQDDLSELSQEKRQKMQEFLRAGKEEYEKGNFEAAIPFLKKAHEIFPKPAFHYRIGLAYERAGKPTKALEYYKKFLDEKPETDKRGQVEKTISRLEQQIAERSRATIRVESSPSGAEVSIGAGSNETRGTTPMEMQVEPGEVKLVLQKAEFGTVSESVDVEAGKSYQYSYSLPRQAGDASGKIRPLPIGLAGAGVVGLTVYAVNEASARCSSWPWRKLDNEQGCYERDFRAEFKRRGPALLTGLGVGIVGLGAASVIWALEGFRRPPEAQTRNDRSSGSAWSVRWSVRPMGVTISGEF